jgi:hypothetical protein
VLNSSATRRRFAQAHALPLVLAVVASNSVAAHASSLLLSTDCSASGDSFKCHLLQLLNLLYIAAAFLGLTLVLVLALAFFSYRKNKQESKQAPRNDL